MADLKFDIGDPVWSKMKGYCPWPSRIAAPHESTLENKEKQKNQKVFYLVFFFGSNNFAWMPEDTVKPYHEFKEKNKNGSKTNQFRAGLKAIEEYIASGGKATLDIPPHSEVSKNNPSNDNATSPSANVDSPEESTNNDGKYSRWLYNQLVTRYTFEKSYHPSTIAHLSFPPPFSVILYARCRSQQLCSIFINHLIQSQHQLDQSHNHQEIYLALRKSY